MLSNDIGWYSSSYSSNALWPTSSIGTIKNSREVSSALIPYLAHFVLDSLSRGPVLRHPGLSAVVLRGISI
jgi:hypothetical protein